MGFKSRKNIIISVPQMRKALPMTNNEQEQEFENWTEKMIALGGKSKDAARLYAFFVAQNDSVDPVVRRIMLQGALQLTERKLKHCLKLLETHGLGKVGWLGG